MKKIVILICLSISLLFCARKDRTVNEEFKEYHGNDTLNNECSIIEKLDDSSTIYLCKEYNEKGVLISEGKYINDIPWGWHSFYNIDNVLEKKIEYVTYIDSMNERKSEVNQLIKFNGRGDTIFSESNFFCLSYDSDSIYLGDTLKAEIELVAPYFDSSYMFVFIEYLHDNTLPVRRLASGDYKVTFDYFPKDTGFYSNYCFIDEVKDSLVRSMYFYLEFYVASPR